MASPLVIDIGAHSLKAGVAGEALPRVVTRSVVGVAAVGDGLTGPSAAAAATAATEGEPVLLQQLLNPLEKADHVEVLPVMPYKATKADAPGTYVPHHAGLERLLDEVLGVRCLDVAGSERPFLLAEPNRTHAELREFYCETAFELFQVPELMLVRKAPLAAFGCARTSAVVCDVGFSHCSVAAVQEGFVLQRLQQEVPLGCGQLLAVTRHLLQQHNITITPGFAILPQQQQHPGADPAAANQQHQQERVIAPCPHVTQTFREFGEQHVLEVLLQLLGKCNSSSSSNGSSTAAALEAAEAAAAATAAAEGPYVLPDGTALPPAVTAGIETTVPDIFFSATLRHQYQALLLPQAAAATSPAAAAGVVTAHQQQQQQQGAAATAAPPGILECIRKCAEGCQGAARRDVLGALVVAGGASQFPGFVKRLKAEAPTLLVGGCGGRPTSNSSSATSINSSITGGIRLVCSRGAVERHMASWIGGSIVGCLSTFSQLAITRKEYQELGPRVCIDRKLP